MRTCHRLRPASRRRSRTICAPLLALPLTALLIAACGGSVSPADSTLSAPTQTSAVSGSSKEPSTSREVGTAGSVAASLRNWPEFGLSPQRTDASNATTGITTANVGHLRRMQIALPGTVDSSPIYLHGITVAGAVRDVVIATTTYGKTLAIDASSGAILWTFTPPGYSHWAGSTQITTASPLADPDRLFIYAASPDGLIHKLALADGSEDSGGAWPSRSRATPPREDRRRAEHQRTRRRRDHWRATAAIPPPTGHVVLIDRASSAVAGSSTRFAPTAAS